MQRAAALAASRNAPAAPPSNGGDDPNHMGPLELAISCLWVFTPLTATVSLVVVVVAMITNQWLHTEEKMNNPSYNGTGEKDYLSKYTISGLWMLCFTNPGESFYECNRIDYFSKEKYSPDPNDSTLAIPYAVTKSIFFFLLASLILSASYCCCIVGQCAKHRKLCTFISGVAFIVSGLVMLLGLIVYISVFKAEVGSKLRPRSQLEPPSFIYHYGFSFLLYVGGFISTQVAGISAVFLFIYRMQREWSLEARLAEADARRGKTPCSGGSTTATTSRPPYVAAAAHYYSPLDHGLFFPCRRHPQAYINSNSSIHVPVVPTSAGYPAAPPSPVRRQRRYFFSKEPAVQESPCSLHRAAGHIRSRSNSIANKDAALFGGSGGCGVGGGVGMVTGCGGLVGDTFYDFPPPPTISYQFEELKSFDAALRQMPRDATTNTVSTTADINSCDDFLQDEPPYEDYSPSLRHEHEFITFDLDRPLPLHLQNALNADQIGGFPAPRKDLNGGSGATGGGGGGGAVGGSDTLRRTTPV